MLSVQITYIFCIPFMLLVWLPNACETVTVLSMKFILFELLFGEHRMKSKGMLNAFGGLVPSVRFFFFGFICFYRLVEFRTLYFRSSQAHTQGGTHTHFRFLSISFSITQFSFSLFFFFFLSSHFQHVEKAKRPRNFCCHCCCCSN